MARIGVEESLTNVTQALQEKGHEIVQLKQEADANNYDCCVISGQDKDVMGIQNVSFNGPVINAEGLSANEIVNEVESRLK